MSASSKKKLRKEQNAEFLTEKQQKERVEAKKFKRNTILFVAAIAVVICAYVGIVVYDGITTNGWMEKFTVAATVGDEKIDSIEMNYYYIDSINNVYNQYGEYAQSMFQMMGLDTTKPLEDQVYDEKENKTWADYFMDIAVERAKRDYVLAAAAEKAGFALSDEDKESLKNVESNLDLYAQFSGLTSGTAYLRSQYGTGASVSSYVKYLERNLLAENYYAKYNSDLNFTEADITEKNDEAPENYNAYDFVYYTVDYTKYLEATEEPVEESVEATEPTTDATEDTTEPTTDTTEPTTEATEPNKTEDEKKEPEYTEEQIAAAKAKAKEIADQLAACENAEAFEAAVAELEIAGKKDQKASHSHYTSYDKINAAYQEWVANKDRAEGDIEVFEYKTTSTDADGKETSELKGYYVVCYEGMTDNKYAMSDVRHLLVKFTDDDEAEVTDEMKAAAKEKAEKLLKEWQDGEATEDSFAALVTKNTEDEGSKQTGGLYERVYEKSNYMENFLNWCIDSKREPGQTDIVETEYGYHIMYYVKRHDVDYRTYNITEDLRTEALDSWYNGLMEPVTTAIGNTKYLPFDLVLGQGQ